MQLHADFIGPVDDVIIGDDKAGAVDDEARAEGRLTAGRLVLPATLAVHELAEELLERRAGRQLKIGLRPAAAVSLRADRLADLGGINIYHRGQQLFRHIGEAFRGAAGIGGRGEARHQKGGTGNGQGEPRDGNRAPQRRGGAGNRRKGCCHGAKPLFVVVSNRKVGARPPKIKPVRSVLRTITPDHGRISTVVLRQQTKKIFLNWEL